MVRNVRILVWMLVLTVPGAAWAMDLDGDGYDDSVDCNDKDPDVHPDADEVCNGRDDNCDAAIDEGFDLDGDGFSPCTGDCDEDDADVHPGVAEVCDGFDNDCDELVDEGYDADGDGHYTCDDPADCNDLDEDVSPDAVEVCNGRDDDCNGEVDEGLDCPTGLPDDLGEQGLMGGGCTCTAAPTSAPSSWLGALALAGVLALRRR